MELNSYGLVLRRLTSNDIEMVRMWRNSDEVRRYMQFREHITIEMQKKWFASLERDRDYYFIIYKDSYPIGMTDIKHIDSSKSGDLGIFIADSESLEIPMLTYRAIFSTIDFAFHTLGLKKITASILGDNERAIRFNKSFGFKKVEDSSELLYYTLSLEDYEKSSKAIKRILVR